MKKVTFLRKPRNNMSQQAIEANRANGALGGRPAKPLPWEAINRLLVVDAENGTVSKKAGKSKKGRRKSLNRYQHIEVEGQILRVHRIVWEACFGPVPSGRIIDHIDGDPANNRITNLRLVDCGGNARNKCMNKTNTSGLPGVGRLTESAWRVAITAQGRSIRLTFASKEEAAKAALDIYKAEGFSPRHYAAIEEYLESLRAEAVRGPVVP